MMRLRARTERCQSERTRSRPAHSPLRRERRRWPVTRSRWNVASSATRNGVRTYGTRDVRPRRARRRCPPVEGECDLGGSPGVLETNAVFPGECLGVVGQGSAGGEPILEGESDRRIRHDAEVLKETQYRRGERLGQRADHPAGDGRHPRKGRLAEARTKPNPRTMNDGGSPVEPGLGPSHAPSGVWIRSCRLGKPFLRTPARSP